MKCFVFPVSVLVSGGHWLVFGLFALGAYMLSAAIGMLLLETINYVEHYGLRRRKLDNGRYERVMPGIPGTVINIWGALSCTSLQTF